MFVTPKREKWLIFTKYDRLIKINVKKTTYSNGKAARDLNRRFTEKYKRQINTWKVMNFTSNQGYANLVNSEIAFFMYQIDKKFKDEWYPALAKM